MKISRSTVRAMAFGLAALGCLAAPAQVPLPAVPPPQPAPSDPNLPEYRVKSLPTDTFRPSEEVSEDQPVPFPADI